MKRAATLDWRTPSWRTRELRHTQVSERQKKGNELKPTRSWNVTKLTPNSESLGNGVRTWWRETRQELCAACRAAGVLRNTSDNYFQGNVSLFERSSLNIKVRLSEDMLDNFKVLRLLCREVLSLCFVQLVCFPLHCEADDKDSECTLHHEPVLCNLQFKDALDIEHDYKQWNFLTGWHQSEKPFPVDFLFSFRYYLDLLRDDGTALFQSWLYFLFTCFTHLSS